MSHRFMFITFLFLVLFIAAPAGADETMTNPSFYNASDIMADMPKYWLANYIEIQEYMKKYPDFKCEHYANEYGGEKHDQIVCNSVNNSRTRDVIINFFFTGDHAGMTGLQETVFTIGTPLPSDFQEVIEYFWFADAFPWHSESDWFHPSFPSLMFRTSSTVLRFDLPYFDKEGDHFTTVDLWDSNTSRLGVG